MTPVTVDHLRAIYVGSRDRTVLVVDNTASRLHIVSPDDAFTGVFHGRCRVLCTRSQLVDAGIRLRADHTLASGSAAACTREAAAITRELAANASGPRSLSNLATTE